MKKTLANCTPSEFVAQTVKIKDAVQNWLDVTKLMSLRTMPTYKTLPAEASAEERVAVIQENAKIKADHTYATLSKMFDACLKEHPQETLEVVALCCFVEPKDIDSNPVSFYLESMKELISDKAVIGFFSSLGLLGQMSGSRA